MFKILPRSSSREEQNKISSSIIKKAKRTRRRNHRQFEPFNIGEWFKVPHEVHVISRLMQTLFSIKHCVTIENGILEPNMLNESRKIYGSNMHVVVLPAYQCLLTFNRAELEQDTMRFFQNLFSDTFADTVYTCILDTGAFAKNTYATGAQVCVLENTDLSSIIGTFTCRFDLDKSIVERIMKNPFDAS